MFRKLTADLMGLLSAKGQKAKPKSKPKRPWTHWVVIGICAAMFAIIWPDNMAGLAAIKKTTHWVENETAFNAFTFGMMIWHVVFWGPIMLYQIWLIYKRNHLARYLGFLLFGSEWAVALVRICFIQFLLWYQAWPEDYGQSALLGGGFWFLTMVANTFLVLFFWNNGRDFNR